MQPELIESTQGASDSAPAIVEPSTADSFGDLVSRITSGDMSADTWILAWETIGRPVLLAIVLIIAVFVAAGWARKIVGKAVRKANVEETLARFLSNMARYRAHRGRCCDPRNPRDRNRELRGGPRSRRFRDRYGDVRHAREYRSGHYAAALPSVQGG